VSDSVDKSKPVLGFSQIQKEVITKVTETTIVISGELFE
jgi:hypothetical protein